MISDTMNVKNVKNIEVISMVELFGEAIFRTIEGDSLSGLFE